MASSTKLLRYDLLWRVLSSRLLVRTEAATKRRGIRFGQLLLRVRRRRRRRRRSNRCQCSHSCRAKTSWRESSRRAKSQENGRSSRSRTYGRPAAEEGSQPQQCHEYIWLRRWWPKKAEGSREYGMLQVWWHRSYEKPMPAERPRETEERGSERAGLCMIERDQCPRSSHGIILAVRNVELNLD